MNGQEPEVIKNKEPQQQARKLHSDEILDTASNMTTDDLIKADAGIKLLTANYKEKCIESRELKSKIGILMDKNSELSSMLAVAKERLRQIGGITIVLNILTLLAGAIIILASFVNDNITRKIFYGIGIAIFLVCIFYYISNRNSEKGIGEKE